MNISMVLLMSLLLHLGHTLTMKTLQSDCLCDISDACDTNCCCDRQCSATAKSIWSKYSSCYNPGLSIPLCTQYEVQSYSPSDLHHGLTLLYTIIRRLFCVSRMNFISSTDSVISKTTDQQISVQSSAQSEFNSNIKNLESISGFPALPLRNSVGSCSSQPLKDMNNIMGQKCRVFVSSAAAYASNGLISLSQLITNNNGLDSLKLRVYTLQLPSSPTQTAAFANTITSACSGSLCLVIKQIQFFFIKTSSGVTIDYNSSYVVVGRTTINDQTSISLLYSYQFKPSASLFTYTSNRGYVKEAYLNLLKSIATTTTPITTTYYKMMNPINLAFVETNGLCITSTSSSPIVDQTSLIRLRFGVNQVHSCIGSESVLKVNLLGAISHVGAYGSFSSLLSDYALIGSDSGLSTSNNQDILLIFYYIPIGTQNNAQYKIVSATVKPADDKNTNIQSLYIEYMPLDFAITLNIPKPPTIDAYLPDDFLYPFYVAG